MAAIRSAKAYKYACEAQDAAELWAEFFLSGTNFAGKAGCGPLIPTKANLIKRAFDSLSDAPDEFIPGGINYEAFPCPSKGCKGCKGPKCRSSNGNGDESDSNTSAKPSPTEDGSSTTINSPSQTTSAATTLLVSSAPPKTSLFTLSSASSESTQPTSSTTSSATPSQTLDCKALAALAAEDEVPESNSRRRIYPIDLSLHHLHKRYGPKTVNACKIKFSSYSYPSSGEWGEPPPISLKRYGFNQEDSCDDYKFDTPDPNAKYDTEHILEWKIVGGFFTQMGKDVTTDFPHPDPEEAKKGVTVKFC